MKIIFIILFVIKSSILLSQTDKLYPKIHSPSSRNISKFEIADTYSVKIWYTLNAIDVDNYDDIHILEIGDNGISKYYSNIIFNSDSLVTEWINKNKKTNSYPRSMYNGGKSYYWSECFKNNNDNTLTEYIRGADCIPNYYYIENIPVQEWDILTDTLTIVGYLCQKATCKFRGREYTAWFTTDIPINNGPWKFGGLPGLILKIYDNDNEFVFECMGIENVKYNIKKFNYKEYAKISREKALKLLKSIENDYFTVCGKIVTSNTNSNSKSTKKPKYNLMLLELE